MQTETMTTEEKLLRSKRSKRLKRIGGYVVKYTVSAVLLAAVLLPVYSTLFMSVMTYAEVNSLYRPLFPSSFRISNYAVFFDYLPSLGNTLIVVIMNAIFIPLTACITAYPFARGQFIGKKVFFGIIMATVMVPSTVLMIPNYVLYTLIGLKGTLASLYFGAFWGGGALNIFLVIQFMRSLPKEMDEAAQIDGANHFRIFVCIIMPLVFNVFVYIAIGQVIGQWMDFQGPLLYLMGEEEKYTLALKFYVDYTNSATLQTHKELMAAMAVCMTIPPAIIYFCFQKQMIGGIKIGGVKG